MRLWNQKIKVTQYLEKNYWNAIGIPVKKQRMLIQRIRNIAWGAEMHFRMRKEQKCTNSVLIRVQQRIITSGAIRQSVR